jgi:TonB family protein
VRAALTIWSCIAALGLPTSSIGQSAKTLNVVPAIYPDAARSAGHQGTTEISALIQADGSLANIKVLQSSHSSILDQAALAAISKWRFVAPVDEKGKPRPFTFTYGFDFYKVPLIRPENALAMLTCRDFVADVEWFETTYPNRSRQDLRDYQAVLLPFVAAAARAASAAEMLHIGKQMRAKAALLDAAFVRCKTAPDVLVLTLAQ